MVALCNRADHYIFILWFLLLSSSSSSFFLFFLVAFRPLQLCSIYHLRYRVPALTGRTECCSTLGY